MGSSLLVLVSLLAGYLFNHLFHLTSYRAQTLAGHRLIFESAGIGLIFLVPARLIMVVWQKIGWPASLFEHWPTLANAMPLVGTCLVMVPLAIGAGIGLNLLIGWRQRSLGEAPASGSWLHELFALRARNRWCNRLFRKARLYWEASREIALDINIRLHGSSLHKLLHHVAVSDPDTGHAVGLTMRNGKTYAAFVTRPPTLSSDDSFVSLMPLLSGHRMEETRQVVYDTPYSLDTLDELRRQSEVVVTVPLSEIQSAHLLDQGYLRDVSASLDQPE